MPRLTDLMLILGFFAIGLGGGELGSGVMGQGCSGLVNMIVLNLG